uniref:Uncharacterized protein n=1 Tax=Ixodes ricinus TaxID=34613 RepID=A0A0K8RM47_IXORI
MLRALRRFESHGERDEHISSKKHTSEKTKKLIGRQSLVISFPPQNTIIAKTQTKRHLWGFFPPKKR